MTIVAPIEVNTVTVPYTTRTIKAIVNNGGVIISITNSGGGSGSGDFVGPGSAVPGNFVSFNGTSGKLGQDSGSNAASFDAAGLAAAALASAFAHDTDALLSTSDITTNDVSTTKHGFVPKLPNDVTKFLDGTGAFSVPSGGSGTVATAAELNTGTDNAKFASALALQGSKYQDQVGSKNYAAATGTDTYAITLTPALGSYAAGLMVVVTFPNANTGAATLNVNALGAKSIVKDGSTALVSGDIMAGCEMILIYDGTNFVIANSCFAGWGKRRIVLASDQVNNNVTPDTMQDITGLQFPVKANNYYYFRFVIYYTAAIGTTGSGWSVNGPTLDKLSMVSHYTLTVTSERINYINAYDGHTIGATSVNGDNLVVFEGVIRCTADGNVIGRFASEVSASAITCKALYSYLEWVNLN